jgi:hypothetical protein
MRLAWVLVQLVCPQQYSDYIVYALHVGDVSEQLQS